MALTALDEHVREVYAFFGLAYSRSNALEAEIVLSLIYLDLLTKKAKNIKRRGIASFDRPTFQAEFDGFMRRHGRRSFSDNLDNLRRKVTLECEVEKVLTRAKQRRNFLAHHFFRARAVDFMKVDGRNAMLAELRADIELFENADAELRQFMAPTRAEVGLSPETSERLSREFYAENGLDPDTKQETDMA